MTAEQLKRWRAELQLSLTAAADALGISRSMLAYYEAGTYPVPLTVELACETVARRSKQKDARVNPK